MLAAAGQLALHGLGPRAEGSFFLESTADKFWLLCSDLASTESKAREDPTSRIRAERGASSQSWSTLPF